MKKLIKLMLGFLLVGGVSSAQTTVVSATVVDSDGTIWTNGSWYMTFTSNPSNPNPANYLYNGAPIPPSVASQSGPLDGTGSMLATVYQSSAIAPAGSGWTLVVCPNASTQCGSSYFAAVGPTMSLSSILTGVIPPPRFKAVANSFGYNDNEASIQLVAGSMYWNVTTASLRCYNNVIPVWAPCNGVSSPFSIYTFTGCGGMLELGQNIINPTCSATYSSTPSSASISNTDSIDSPLVLITPFTSGTITGTFSHNTTTTTTVTLTAIGSSTQVATQTYTWKARIFGGSGAAGATSSVTASGNTAVLSNSSVLSSAGLGAEVVGQTFGPYTVSGQNIYLLLLGSSHTFIDANTGFPFAFNFPTPVTFVNQYGVTVTMYLYQSTNALFGSYAPKVVS